MTNDTPPSRDDLADRIMDLALREKAGGKTPPDLSAQILARAEQQVNLPEGRGARADSKYGRFAPVGVSLCLLGLALLSAVLFQPEAALKMAELRDGDLLRTYEKEERTQAKLFDLVETFNNLIDEQRYSDAEVVAMEAKKLIPGSPVTDLMVEKSRTIRSIMSQTSPRDLKERGFYDVYGSVDLAITPWPKERQAEFAAGTTVQLPTLPAGLGSSSPTKKKKDALGLKYQIEDSQKRLYDDAPIAYPDSRTWEELSKRRKKYQSHDVDAMVDKTRTGRFMFGVGVNSDAGVTGMIAEDRPYSEATVWYPRRGNSGSAEAKINLALTDPTTIGFNKTPFKEVVDYLKDLHGIEIQINEKALKSVGVASDKPITYNVKGSSLYSSLNDLLDGLGLTYQIKGEVLQITSPEAAGNRVAKVEGQITAVGGSGKLVEISLGSDDGLRAGRVLNAYADGGTVLLGGIKVVKTTPDRAVAVLAVASAVPITKGLKVSGKIFDLPREPEIVPEPVEAAEPDPAGDKFDLLPENDFEKVKEAPLSTFSIDVDTASYSKVRQFLMVANQLPPGEAVRLEELVNYFPYDYAPPKDDKPFAAHVETAACPWNGEHRLVHIGLKGKVVEAAERPACNLVFLVDVSGSMDEPNKLTLVTHGLKMLAGELTDRDRVSIVVYAGAAGMVLPPTRGDARPTIYSALSSLKAGGSTNGGEGIELAYKTCQENFIEGGANRVILCTDGDFNVGLTSTGQLVDLAKEKAQKGVFLSVLGFGMGNHNDEMLEAVSNKANGNHAFIDSLNEARKVLVREISGTLVTIAKDVKIQVDFNPAEVASYRLLGYENRMLAAEDFADDKKDAGEIGGGHTVTALYEIVPTPTGRASEEGKSKETRSVSEEKKQKLLTLKLRYKQPDGDTSALLEFPIEDSGQRFSAASGDFQFAAAVASFGMILRKSKHAGDATLASVAEIATAAKGPDLHGYRAEFVELVKKAGELGAK